MKKPELLAPAGNMEKLRVAVHYGADAVYLGGKAYGLRNQAENFDLEELKEAADFCASRGVKTYLTVNSYPGNAEVDGIARFLEDTAQIPLTACIAADPGVVALIREITPEREIHLSTQANTTNWMSARFWKEQGVSRVNLARETPLDAIREVKERAGMEVEVFVHGAMCISYSGRCLLSTVMTGRNANHGECAHPCRWSYSLVEETRPDERFPILEDETGTFIFNSRDLCLIEHLPELVAAGVDSLKIEGRMKGTHYVAAVTRIYREALDRLCEDPDNYRFDPRWLEELCKISHRGYTTGFLFGPPRDVDREFRSRYLRSHDFVALVEEALPDGRARLKVRNRMAAGETIEFIGPGMASRETILTEMSDVAGKRLETAHPNSTVIVTLPFPVQTYDIARRAKNNA